MTQMLTSYMCRGSTRDNLHVESVHWGDVNEPVSERLQSRMADGVTILHQASGELLGTKSLFKKPKVQAGTFLIIGSHNLIAPMFLARDAEDSMQTELLAFRIGRGDCLQSGNRIVLTDGQTMVFRGGPEAATIFVGTFILHSPSA